MAFSQIYLHGIISLLLVWQCPIENCTAAPLRQNRPNRDLGTKSKTISFGKKKRIFVCTDDEPIYSFEQCRDNIEKSDNFPTDLRLNRIEFLDFISLQTQGVISPESFVRLPMNLVMTFNQVACECLSRQGTSKDCCVGDNAQILLSNDAEGICSRLGNAVGESCRILRKRMPI